ncbi:MAG TPA: hypothetical protein VFG83_03790 [Kofleriaceae bacterium]|nr:hypothetical protein [Kofleriaceae bacterium]
MRVLLVYNTDYDAELMEASPADVSAVREAALAVAAGVDGAGHGCEVLGIGGPDITTLMSRLKSDPPDLVFNLCESLAGNTKNEVVVPALLDLAGVAYTGPGPLAIGLCLHKDRTKDILVARGVPTPPSVVLAGEADFAAAEAGNLAIDYPCFVKLCHEDASVGIDETNVAANPAALARRARQLVAAYRQPVLAEAYVDGREVNVTLMGNGDEVIALPLHEIDFSAMPAHRPRIVSYAAKWDPDHVDFGGTVPVPVTAMAPAQIAAVTEVAIAAYGALGLRDFGRVDVRIAKDGTPMVIDVNPNCDLSPDAGFARAAAAAGMSYADLVGRICELASRRHADLRHAA